VALRTEVGQQHACRGARLNRSDSDQECCRHTTAQPGVSHGIEEQHGHDVPIVPLQLGIKNCFVPDLSKITWQLNARDAADASKSFRSFDLVSCGYHFALCGLLRVQCDGAAVASVICS
jgi:hypothetical protein